MNRNLWRLAYCKKTRKELGKQSPIDGFYSRNMVALVRNHIQRPSISVWSGWNTDTPLNPALRRQRQRLWVQPGLHSKFLTAKDMEWGPVSKTNKQQQDRFFKKRLGISHELGEGMAIGGYTHPWFLFLSASALMWTKSATCSSTRAWKRRKPWDKRGGGRK